VAKPRVFISSTFFDLRQVREELERFVREMGYEPVRHETGAIPYYKEEPLESSAYREVELCDIIVNIVGGRFGTASGDGSGNSITQRELATALERGVQVFIFVEQAVRAELDTCRLNKTTKGINYSSVDDIRILDFLDTLYQLKQNNPITSFQTAKDIVEFLRAQWAGLFQRFLREPTRIAEFRALEEMKSITATLQQTVDFLTKANQSNEEAVKNILLVNHPVFRRLAKLTGTNYRVFFENLDELNKWLKVRGYEPQETDHYDDDSLHEWWNERTKAVLKITRDIFDVDGRLLNFGGSWDDDWVSTRRVKSPPDENPDKHPDDIPF
jgi:Domain of unknown function (DUF4062)